ncbi:MAG: ABC transporter ATP-binding protein, partial [Geminicoccaceae bacterium]
MTAAFLDLQKLSVDAETPRGKAKILRRLNLTLSRGERLGIVGESGSGKSMMALAIMGLLPNAAEPSGRLMFEGDDLLTTDEKKLCRIRGRRIAMVFQEPMSALNPVQPIGDQIAEGPRLHLGLGHGAAMMRAKDLLTKVGLPPDQVPPGTFPHQLSGGQRQRVMIAIALASEPDILIADEPTTALDVTIQIGILDLITKLADETGMALIMISHDLGVIARTTTRIAVMYAGRLVEQGPTARVLRQMAHPYTQGLHAAMPQHAEASHQPARRRPRLPTIPGVVPAPFQPNIGCAFAERCSRALADCRADEPDLETLTPDHNVACFHPLT